MKYQEQKIKGFSNPARVIRLADGSWVLLVIAHKQIGGWKWAHTRVVARVYHTDQNPTVYRPRPDDIRWESGEFTLDYQGGKYGYAADLKEAEEFFEYLASKDA